MLNDPGEIYDLLRCPKSRSRLKKIGDVLRSDSDDGAEYKIIDGRPVLVDFDNSILDKRGSFHSAIERRQYRGLLRMVKRLISPPQAVTVANVSAVKAFLHSKENQRCVLIIGGGTVGQGMNYFYDDPDISLVSFDIYASPNVQFLADAHRIPLADGSFDVVIVQAVLEHVLEPSVVVSEIYRVLAEGGIVYAETPFLQHVHEGPYDFTRFTESGHRYLFRDFELIRSGATAGAGTQLLWSLDNFARGLFRSKIIGKAVKLCLFWLRHFDRLIPESYNIDAASGVFFLGRKSISRLEASAIVIHYKGAQ